MRCTIIQILIFTALGSTTGKAETSDSGTLALSSRILNYQAYLTDTLGNPINNNSLTMVFEVYDSLTGGNKLWTETLSVAVQHGIFQTILGSVNPLPDTIFQRGSTYGLQMTIAGQALAPRTRIGSLAYALYAVGADTADYAVQCDDDDWMRADSVLFTVRSLGIAKGASNNMLYGAARYTHTNLGVTCTTGVSGYDHPYITVTGGSHNIAGNTGVTISNGYRNKALASYAVIGGGGYSYTNGDYSVIAGGNADTSVAPYGGILSGYYNHAGDAPDDTCAAVAGGMDNSAWSKFALVGGGRSNTALNYYATVGGGYGNAAWGQFSIVAGGQDNVAFQHHSAVLGGYADTARALYSGVLAGYSNKAGQAAGDTAAICLGGYDNRALFMFSFIGGGRENWVNDIYGTVIGGYRNQAINHYATVIGGNNNSASGMCACVGGGTNNSATGDYSTVIGGYANAATGSYSAVAGGYIDTAAGSYGLCAGNHSVVPGTYSNSTAFNGQAATATGETHVGILSKAGGTFTIDHPLDPDRKILNHYFVESPDMTTIYRGTAVLDGDGRAEVFLPTYFDTLNRRPLVQVSAVGDAEAYVMEKVKGNRFVIAGTPGTEVSWIVTGQRRDQTAEITRVLMPVEQTKEGSLAGHYLDDDLLRATRSQLIKMGIADRFKYRAENGAGSNDGGR